MPIDANDVITGDSQFDEGEAEQRESNLQHWLRMSATRSNWCRENALRIVR